MGTQKLKPKFQCGCCDEIHDHFSDAEDCCTPEVNQIYQCPVCNEAHDLETDAVNCCIDKWDGDEMPAPRISAAELEAAGQMRLIA